MAPVLLCEASATQSIPSRCDCFQAWRPMHSDYLQTWRPHSIFQSHVTQTPPGNWLWSSQQAGPHQRATAACALLPSSYVTFPIPVSILSALSPVQAPGLDSSTPCQDFCPGFCFCPASSLLPSCPPVFISLLTREHRAPSHPNPGIEVWQHPVGFNS